MLFDILSRIGSVISQQEAENEEQALRLYAKRESIDLSYLESMGASACPVYSKAPEKPLEPAMIQDALAHLSFEEKAAWLIAHAADYGVSVLYPTDFLANDSDGSDRYDFVMGMWGNSGAFKMFLWVDLVDLAVVAGFEEEQAEEIAAAQAGSPREVLTVAAGDERFPHTENILCYWTDENPFPGIKESDENS